MRIRLRRNTATITTKEEPAPEPVTEKGINPSALGAFNSAFDTVRTARRQEGFSLGGVPTFFARRNDAEIVGTMHLADYSALEERILSHLTEEAARHLSTPDPRVPRISMPTESELARTMNLSRPVPRFDEEALTRPTWAGLERDFARERHNLMLNVGRLQPITPTRLSAEVDSGTSNTAATEARDTGIYGEIRDDQTQATPSRPPR